MTTTLPPPDDDATDRLLAIRRAKLERLRVIEQQIDHFGEDYAPAHLLVECARLRQELGVVDTAVRSPVSGAIGDELGTAGRFMVYYEQGRQANRSIAQLCERLDTFIADSLVFRVMIRRWLIAIGALVFLLALVVTWLVARGAP